jgi:hypothetical protein
VFISNVLHSPEFCNKNIFKKIKFPEKLFFSISFSYSPVAVQLYTKEQQQ